jgi:hypothetical protein
MPSDEEISRIRRLINRITIGLDELTGEQRERVEQPATVVRQHRTLMLGMRRIRQILPDLAGAHDGDRAPCSALRHNPGRWSPVPWALP